jgi:hypothetical protein
MSNETERITVSIAENGVWATDAHLVSGKWQDGATLIPDEDGCPSDADDALYAAIAASIEAGDTDGRIETDDSVYTWRAAGGQSAPIAEPEVVEFAPLSVGELQREDMHTQLLQRIAYKCTGSDQSDAQFRNEVKREYPDLKLSRNDWARLRRFRDGVLERMGR